MNKGDAEEYITDLLHELNCRGIKPTNTGDLHCQCPYHRPRNNVTAFGISFTREDKGYPWHCLSCKERGNLAQLVSMAYSCSYKRATRLIARKIALKPITIKRLGEDLIRLTDLSQRAVRRQNRVNMPERAGNQKPMIKYLKRRKRRARNVLNVPYIVNKYGIYYCGTGRMSGRIIMPIRVNGEVIGINDRTIDENARNKSLHIPGQEYGELLHGIDEAVGRPIGVLVEGAFDMWQCVSAIHKERGMNQRYGFINNMGTSFSEVKAAIILENFEELVIMFDNQEDDKGNNEGFDGAVKWSREMRDLMTVRNVTTEYPRGKDPGICTKEQIINAISSKGYIRQTSLQKLKCGATIKL